MLEPSRTDGTRWSLLAASAAGRRNSPLPPAGQARRAAPRPAKPSRLRAKSAASKGCRPRPPRRHRWRAPADQISRSATTTPPRAEPSNLVTIKPLTSVTSWKAPTWPWAFWPTVPSRPTRSWVPPDLFGDHAVDFGQFVHQFALVLQPPGGVDKQHVDRRLAGRGRAKATAAASAPGAPAITSTPTRSPQTCNCSTAAARCRRRRTDGDPRRGISGGANRGGFAAAVNADEQDHMGAVARRHGQRTRRRRRSAI